MRNILKEQIDTIIESHKKHTEHHLFDIEHHIENDRYVMLYCGMPAIDDGHKSYKFDLEELAEEHEIEVLELVSCYKEIYNPTIR